MYDLQSKFVFTVVAFGLFFAYAFPKAQDAKQDRDAVVRHAGEVYVPPTPNDPHALSGWVSFDDLQKDAERKAAERKARRLQ